MSADMSGRFVGQINRRQIGRCELRMRRKFTNIGHIILAQGYVCRAVHYKVTVNSKHLLRLLNL